MTIPTAFHGIRDAAADDAYNEFLLSDDQPGDTDTERQNPHSIPGLPHLTRGLICNAMLPNNQPVNTDMRRRNTHSIPGLSNARRKSILWLSQDQPMLLSLIGFTLLFSACHLANWQYPFSTMIEVWLWRTSSLVCPILPLCVVLVQFTCLQLSPGLKHLPFMAVEAFTVLCVLLYLSCRLCLLVQIFVALRSVPSGVYDAVPWAQYLPHI